MGSIQMLDTYRGRSDLRLIRQLAHLGPSSLGVKGKISGQEEVMLPSLEGIGIGLEAKLPYLNVREGCENHLS